MSPEQRKLFERGIQLLNENKLDEAIAVFTEIIGLYDIEEKEKVPSYFHRGLAYREQGDYVRAIADYDKAIELQADYAQAYNNRGIVYSVQGDYVRAIADHDKAIELRPNFSGAYNNRGVAYKGQGDYVRAIADYDKAIELQAEIMQLLITIAGLLIANKVTTREP